MNRIIDDKIQFAGKWDKDIYISKNAGKSFELFKSISGPKGLAMSSDMTHMIIVYYSRPPIISHNSGQDWINTSLHNDYWESVKMSSNGKVMMVNSYGDASISGFFLSMDYGSTWRKMSGNGRAANMSDDGRCIVYCDDNNIKGFYLSIDYGNSFSKILTWASSSAYLAISSKGKSIIISSSSSFYISTDYGQSFVKKNSSVTLCQIDYISDDGLLIYARNRSGYSVVSFDEGNSFVETSSVGSVRNLCVSNKTNKIYYASYKGLYSSSDYLKSSDLNNHFGATNMSFVTILK